MVGHRPWRKTTPAAPQTATTYGRARKLAGKTLKLQYTGAMQVAATQSDTAQQNEKGKSTYVHPAGEPQAQDLSHMLDPKSTI